MALEQITNGDTFIDLGTVSNEGYSDISGRIAYRIYIDYRDGNNYIDNSDNIKVRIEITYVHIKGSSGWQTTGGGFWNGVALSWFNRNAGTIGKRGTVYGSANFNSDGYNGCADDFRVYVNGYPAMYNSYPIVAVAYPDDINQGSGFSGASYSTGTYNPSYVNQHGVALWGDIFNKSPLNLEHGGYGFHLYSSICCDKYNISAKISYNDDLSYNKNYISVVEPYTGGNALSSIEMTIGELKNQGLVNQYTPSDVTDEYNPYIFNGSIPVATWWTRWLETDPANGNYNWSCLSAFSSPVESISLKYPTLPDLPTYDPPEPVKEFDDNTVFRLKKQYNEDGSLITDKNGYPIMKWFKCEKIGKGAL